MFGEALVAECRRDDRVIGITAAMNSGTGLNILQRELPDRYYDVGIAEQQAVLFAAGLSLQGCKPVAAIYSTFLQRAYDQIVHDVCLQRLNVTFAMDRAGLVGDDGPTHHGAFDIAYLRCLPNIVLMAPRDEAMLVHMLRTALTYDDGPIALRYPRGEAVGAALPRSPQPIEIGTGEILREAGPAGEAGGRVALLGYGTGVGKSLAAAEILADHGISVTVADARFAKPIDAGLVGAARGRARAAGDGRGGRPRRRFWLGGVGDAVRRRSRRADSPRRPARPLRHPRRADGCCTRRSGSRASASPSGSRRRSPSTAPSSSRAACEIHGRRATAWSNRAGDARDTPGRAGAQTANGPPVGGPFEHGERREISVPWSLRKELAAPRGQS